MSLSANHPDLVAVSYNNIGRVYNGMREYSKALSCIERVLHMEENNLPANDHRTTLSHKNMGAT